MLTRISIFRCVVLCLCQITAAIAARTVDALSVALSAAAPYVATPAVSKLVDRGNALKYVGGESNVYKERSCLLYVALRNTYGRRDSCLLLFLGGENFCR